ncbi:uncharacterized protein LOC131040463 [Cryptomeria japonica]|uniref:uncharacterized protein LOC131040463 n=1 Tax=Cryptomeria japonica TaxID=3369 RepID=UPI0027DAB117|nr:uncharacterized protein LOC131040463 [Cryptomeria japonica]
MKFLTWNVRGCNAPDKRRLIKRGFDQAKPKVICIQETKLGREDAARVFGVRQRWFGFFVESEGASGGLGILWNPLVVQVDVVSCSKHWQMVKVNSKIMNFSCFLINVYGPTLAMEKCRLWEDISKLLEEVRPTLAIVVGDFNATLSFSEKRGGVRRMCKTQSDFQTFVNFDALFEVVAKGGRFTWTNRRWGFSYIAEKLDRFFLAGDWNLAPLIFEAEVLAISGLDHFPVSLVVQKDEVLLQCPFKVEKMWLRELGFRDQVVGWWKEAPMLDGFLAFQFFKKLSYVKQKLKSWNREVFGNIFDEKRRIDGDLGALNAKVLAEGMDELDYLMEEDLLSRYGEVLQREKIYWKQKLRENWLKADDRNTNFFHSSVKARRSLNRILSLWLANGTSMEDPNRICKEAVDFFGNLWRRNEAGQAGVELASRAFGVNSSLSV